MDLKSVLMVLGHRLVLEKGFIPSDPITDAARQILAMDFSTDGLTFFVEWINLHPEVQEILRDMGIKWSMMEN